MAPPWIVALSCDFGSGSRPQSFFEKLDYRQQTAPMTALMISATMSPTRTKPASGKSQPARTTPIMPTTVLNSKTVTLDELGLSHPATPPMIRTYLKIA